MKILSASVTNFGSYKALDFNFDSSKLCLVTGPTGARKSTLCDIIPWVLYGKTAKEGAADEVRSWDANDSTTGTVQLLIDNKSVRVFRSRGPNDLHYSIDGQSAVRGKDLGDTQKSISALLGMDAETYLAAAYLHEFSQTSQFFNTTAKNRRLLTEQLVDLSFPIRIQDLVSASKKQIKESLLQAEREYDKKTALLENMTESLVDSMTRQVSWNRKQTETIEEAKQKLLNFENEKAAQIANLTSARNKWQDGLEAEIATIKARLHAPKSNDECSECGAIKHTSAQHEKSILKLKADLDKLMNRVNPYREQIEREYSRENTYADQALTLAAQTNPHTPGVEKQKHMIALVKADIDSLGYNIAGQKVQQADFEVLENATASMRSLLISRNVAYLEHSTNDLLSKHFDAEIRVRFSADSADKLEVLVSKDGNDCSFTQLSKGQRQLLKLAFGVSAMKAVSNHNGNTPNVLFFDECLTGLDETFKAKAFDLLQALSLEYDSVLVVEHSENFKELFENRYEVALTASGSVIEQT